MAVFAACAPVRQTALEPAGAPAAPRFEDDAFVSFDGARLGLTVWEGEGASGEAPWAVVVGVHGMNDYANAFHMAAPAWAAEGVTTYAYDQRGFGRSPNRGVWPEEELMREDLRTAVSLARAKHPDALLAVVGISMGGAVAMTAFGSDRPPEGVDRLVLSGPGLRGWGALPWSYRISLWLSAHIRPDWVVVPPRQVAVTITPSDNVEMRRRLWDDPLGLKNNRIDAVHGVVSVMEHAHEVAHKLPENTLVLYGAKDQVIPPNAFARTVPELPAHVKGLYYENGYHMLQRDLQAAIVHEDVLAFLKDPNADAPSGSPDLPWRASF